MNAVKTYNLCKKICIRNIRAIFYGICEGTQKCITVTDSLNQELFISCLFYLYQRIYVVQNQRQLLLDNKIRFVNGMFFHVVCIRFEKVLFTVIVLITSILFLFLVNKVNILYFSSSIFTLWI